MPSVSIETPMLNVLKLEHKIQQVVENKQILGLAVAIIQEGRLIYVRGFGSTTTPNGEEPVPTVTPYTLFPFGAISTNFCAALILRLVEQGKLDLQQPVVNYLPGFSFSHAAWGRQVTLTHLLSHTAGLPATNRLWGGRDSDVLRRFVWQVLPHYSLLAEPGRFHLFSEGGISLAGHIAEVVMGRQYEALLQEWVFAPLQMDDCTFDPTVAMTHPLALPQEMDENGRFRPIRQMPHNPAGHPSGFVYGRILDLINLATMYLQQGHYNGQPFLTPASVHTMQQLHGLRYVEAAAYPMAHSFTGYGLGFVVGSYQGKRMVRHGGHLFSSQYFFDLFPDQQSALILLTNASQDETLLQLVQTLYQQLLNLPESFVIESPLAPRPLPSLPLAACEGIYLQVEQGRLTAVIVEDDTLALFQDDEGFPLFPYGPGQFYYVVGEGLRVPVTFLPEVDGPVQHLLIDGTPYHRLEIDPTFEPDASQWRPFVGVYQETNNPNQEEIFHIRLEEEQLWVAQGQAEVAATPLGEGVFISPYGLMQFAKAENGRSPFFTLGKAVRYGRVLHN